MSLIDGSYFKREIIIPNIRLSGAYTPDIVDAIAKYESEILILLLGYELYKLLLADLSEQGEPQSDRFKRLVNGSEFNHTDDNRLLKWIGLKNSQKESLIAYYVYYNYVYHDNTHLSGIGAMQIQPENGSRVSPFDKLQVSWSKFQKLYAGFDFEVNSFFSDQGTKVNSLPGTFNYLPTAYNFLYANKSDYPEWVFSVVYDKNIFSL